MDAPPGLGTIAINASEWIGHPEYMDPLGEVCVDICGAWITREFPKTMKIPLVYNPDFDNFHL
jgi:hypothetical protein